MMTFEFSYEELADLLEQYLRDAGEITEDQTVLSVDIPIPINENSMIEIDFEVVS